MSSLYVDRKGIEMRLDGGAIAFFENGARIGTVPAEALERIYLRGDVGLTSGLLGRLGQLGIGVIILSGRRAEPSIFFPRPHNDAAIRLAQAKLHFSETASLAIARWMIRGKIGAHLELVNEWLECRPSNRHVLLDAGRRLGSMRAQLPGKDSLDGLRGVEGAAAAQFFLALQAVLPPSVGFSGRNRRPPKDPANAILSLGYTVLTAEAALAAHGNGFDPAVGFLHRPAFGRPSFACDLAEPLRHLIDRLTWRLFSEQILRTRDFTTEKDGACLLMKAGRERFYTELETALGEARKRLSSMLRALREMIETQADATTLSDLL